jgi:hypothetical protein
MYVGVLACVFNVHRSAVILCVIGVIYCISGFACKDDRPVAVDLKAGGNGRGGSSGGHPWKDPDTSGPGPDAFAKNRELQPPPQSSQWPQMADEAL